MESTGTDRSFPPPIRPMGELIAERPHTMRMAGGVPLYIIKAGKEEVLRIDILIYGGQWSETIPLQAMFTHRMLREGTLNRSAGETARKLDEYGAWLELYTSAAYNCITLYTLRKFLPQVLPLLTSMLKEPLFSVRSLSSMLKTQKSFFLVNGKRVKVAVARKMNALLFGEEHPSGHEVQLQDFDRIDRASLQQYFKDNYHSQNISCYLSGWADERAVELVRHSLGEDVWGCGRMPAKALPYMVSPTDRTVKGRKFIPFPDSVQCAVRIGRRVMNPLHADYMDFRILITLLGGYFGSRLMKNLREKNGYTYGVWAGVTPYPGTSTLIVSAEADNSHAEPLIGGIYAEMERLQKESVPQDELKMVQNYAIGELCREYEGAFGLADAYIGMQLIGQSFDQPNRYVKALMNITPERIQELAVRYLRPEEMCEVVAGR